jgi:kynurenine formamidase
MAQQQQQLNNWGRWGNDDKIGMLNLQNSESIVRAMQLVKKGKLYNLSVPLEADGPQWPAFHKTWQTTFLTTNVDPCAFQVADDILTLVTHSGTHMDALGHCWNDGTLWNGRSHDHVDSYGTRWAGIENVRGFVTRGVMLDIPRFKKVEHLQLGEAVSAEDMESCARAQRIEIQSGDVLFVRTGWYRVFQSNYELWKQGEPGPDASCTAWLKEKNIIAIGADNSGVEAYIRTRWNPRLHITALRDLGVYLIEHVDLEELARDQVYEFLFVAAPLRLPKATGSPMTPLAIV